MKVAWKDVWMDERWVEVMVDWKVVHWEIVKDVTKVVWMDVLSDILMVDCLAVQ